MKKGFTILELLITIAILAVIMLVVGGVYIVGLQEYPKIFNQSQLQSNANTTLAGIVNNIKQGTKIPDSYDIYTKGASVLIIELPAQDTNGDFIYVDDVLQVDTFIYSLNGNDLEKRVFGYDLGVRGGDDGNPSVILRNVTALNCTYDVPSNPVEATCSITTEDRTNLKTYTYTATRTAYLRNKK